MHAPEAYREYCFTHCWFSAGKREVAKRSEYRGTLSSCQAVADRLMRVSDPKEQFYTIPANYRPHRLGCKENDVNYRAESKTSVSASFVRLFSSLILYHLLSIQSLINSSQRIIRNTIIAVSTIAKAIAHFERGGRV